MHPKYRFCLRSLAAAASLHVAAVAAQESADDRIHGDEHEHDVLEEVHVTATAIPREALELSQSATVLRGEALADVVNNNIGDTLASLPGLANASFGENVGRPVIRGLQGGRVGVLNDGMTSFDASAVSQDHAVPTEPFLADQVEVLRGPTTLLYGSGAIGGVVNMVTNTIPVAMPENGVDGRVLVQGDSAADQRFGAGRLDFGIGDFAFHVDGFVRRTDDYEIPGAADLYPEDDDHDDHEDDHEDEHDDHEDDHDEHDEESTGVLENSFLDNEGGSVGVAWIKDDWRVGASWTDYDSHYGIPGAHSHHHDHDDDHDEHEDDHEDEHDHEDHDDEHEDENVTIRLESQRADAIATKTDPFSGFSRFTLKTNITRYTHTEFEGEEIGTVFDSDTTNARLELEHSPWGDWTGTFGAQWSDNDFVADGAEAFVPPSETRSGALFWVETAEFENWTVDLGLRYEDTSIDSFLLEHDHEHEDEHEEDHEDEHEHDDEHGEEHMEPASRDFQPFSASIGAIWHMTDASHLAFNFSHAERAPSSEELFANGPHIATQAFEVGDPDLGTETNTHFEVSWRLHEGPLTAMITVYHDDFDDFIYLVDAGEEVDGLPEYLWSQQDAEFTGGEVEVRWDVGDFTTGHWQLFGFYDAVKGTLKNGGPVPRIPPQRFGLGVDWDNGAWAGGLNWIRAAEHNRTAVNETITPGYDLLNAELSWALPFGERMETVLFVQGRNLLDEDVRNSTSFLKDQAPQIGRNWILGLKAAF